MRFSRGKPGGFFICGAVLILGIGSTKGSTGNTAIESSTTYPAPFHTEQIHSVDITPFYRWTGVLRRMDAQTRIPRPWLDNKSILAGLPAREMARKVNDAVNSYDYIADPANWGKSDYWETPSELFARGGDCEDFAIAKYAWLRFLGIPEERLLVAIVHDRIRNIPHAVLILYIDNKAMILDSQVKDIRDSNTTDRYRMLYSINRLGWWLPITSQDMLVSMNGNTDIPEFSKACLVGISLPQCINAIEPAAQ